MKNWVQNETAPSQKSQTGKMPSKRGDKPALTEEQRQLKRENDKIYRRQKRWHDNIIQGNSKHRKW
jgi:hypothetical protein